MVDTMRRSPAVVIVQKISDQCSECGASCQRCARNTSINLEKELDRLHDHLRDSDERMQQMNADFVTARQSLEHDNIRLLDDLQNLRDKYERLNDSFVKLQKLNHTLESRLLITVENYELEKKLLNENASSLNSRLLDAQVIICDLQDDLERCRSDCNIAVQLLHCKPSQFVGPQLTMLPVELQQRLQTYVDSSSAADSSLAASSSLPRTAVVCSVSHPTTGAQSRLVCSAQSHINVGASAVSTASKILSKPSSLKPRSGRLVICSRCQMAVGVVDCAVQTELMADAQHTNGFIGTSAKQHSNAQRSQKTSVETRI